MERGSYSEAYKLETSINTALSECTPYVNPDESLLIFARSVNGKPDLFISKRDDQGAWLEAIPLGPEINTGYHEMCPRISADGKYFFFISSREGLFSAYWVDAGILETGF
jgi:Tol biopolymer transport system component